MQMQTPYAQRVVASTSPSASTPPFDEIYEAHFSLVWRSARRLGIPEAHLEDVTQEIFLIVFRKLPGFEGRSTLRTWIFSIMLHVVRRQKQSLRANSPIDPPAEREIPNGEAGPDESLARRQASAVLHRFLESLDDDKREVFILAELEQMSASEISAVLQIGTNTVYSRLRLAREAFSSAISRHRAREQWRSR
jgi:RNA polymerase sigma-70 factor (ECF subfamily)